MHGASKNLRVRWVLKKFCTVQCVDQDPVCCGNGCLADVELGLEHEG